MMNESIAQRWVWYGRLLVACVLVSTRLRGGAT
jgi:hypothetical protein